MDGDLDLLKQYLRDGSEAAFAEVVRRHVDLVFSVALRKVRSRQLAEEVVQSTFLDLARSISRLRPDTVVSAWLHRVAHRTAVDAVRRETSRAAREQMAVTMSSLNSPTDPQEWSRIEPILDDEVAALRETDRVAVVLRFFEGRSFTEVGHAIGLSDDAAQKRVSRALEKLRNGLQRRGVTVGPGTLLAVISTKAVQAAPAGLAMSVAGAVASAAVVGGGIAASAAGTATLTVAQKAGIALTAAVTVGITAHQTQRIHRLERELAEAREDGRARVQAPADPTPKVASQSQARWTSSPDERDRLIAERDAAERLAELYRQIATGRETAGATNQFPTTRHVRAAMGRLLRESVLMQDAFRDKPLDQLSPEEQEGMKSGGVALVAEVATLAEAELQLSRQPQQPIDPVDDLAVFAYGALDLDEQQFRDVYTLLRGLERDAADPDTAGGDPSQAGHAGLREINTRGQEQLKTLLNAEQQRLFHLLQPHLTLVRLRQKP